MEYEICVKHPLALGRELTIQVFEVFGISQEIVPIVDPLVLQEDSNVILDFVIHILTMIKKS